MKIKVITLCAVILASLSCKNKRYDKENLNLLFGDGGHWYLQKFIVNGHDSLPGLLKKSTKQTAPLSYYFSEPEKKGDTELGRFTSNWDHAFFELDKSVKSLNITMTALSCECQSSIKDKCVLLPFIVKKTPEKWNIIELDEQVLELELNADVDYKMKFTRYDEPFDQ